MHRYTIFLRLKIDTANIALAEVIAVIKELDGIVIQTRDFGFHGFAHPPREFPQLKNTHDYEMLFDMNAKLVKATFVKRLKFVPNLLYQLILNQDAG